MQVNDELRPLPMTVPLGRGEHAASLLSRLAARQGSLSSLEFCTDIGLNYRGVLAGDDQALSDLACLSGADLCDLKRNAIRKQGPARLVGSEELRKPNLMLERLRVCPRCLAEDVSNRPDLPPDLAFFGRTRWLVRPIYTCLEHNVRLVELGRPETGEYTQDFAALLFNRDIDVRAMSGDFIDQAPTAFEAYVGARLSGGAKEDTWLDKLPLFAALRAAEMFGCASLFGPRFLVPKGQEKYRDAAQEGYRILAGGQPAIAGFLSQMRSNYDRVVNKLGGPKTSLGYLWAWAEKDLARHEYSALREVFTDFLLENWPLGPGDTVFGNPVPHRVLHSVRTVANLTGLHYLTVRKMLREVGAIDASHKGMPDTVATFPAELGDLIVREAPTAMSLEEVDRVYSLPRPHKYMLFREQYIRPLFQRSGPRDGNNVGLYFSRTEIEVFLGKLLKAAVNVAESGPNHLTIPYAAKKACTSAKTIIDLILADKLDWVGRDLSANGFMAVLVDLSEIREKTRGPDLDGIPMADAERQVCTTYKGLKNLIRRGWLETVKERSPLNKCPQTVITRDSMERWNTTYVTLGRLATEHRMHKMRARKRLKHAGVVPAIEDREHRLTVYRRDQIPKAI